MSPNVGLGGLGVGCDLDISGVSFRFCLWDPWILLSSATLSWLPQPDQHRITPTCSLVLSPGPLVSLESLS